MLITLMLWCAAFIQNPHFTVTNKVGEFVEVLNPQYDKANDQTYGIVTVYVEGGQDTTPALLWMQPRPFKGQPSMQDMLKSIDHDNGITVVGLQ